MDPTRRAAGVRKRIIPRFGLPVCHVDGTMEGRSEGRYIRRVSSTTGGNAIVVGNSRKNFI